MITSRENLINLSSILAEVAETIKETDCKSRLNNTIEQLQNTRPRVIVYGKYNSGKSTLINALISQRGEEVTATADHPKTAVSKAFDYRGADLLDTPGILAPEDHEQVAKETLLNAELVLFVVSTQGAFDEAKVVSELHQIIDSGRPTLIIINDKDGYLGFDGEGLHPNLELILQKARSNVGQRGVNGQVRYLAVDAKNGFKAKEYAGLGKAKAQSAFWQRSGLDLLESALEESLQNFTEEDRIRPHLQAIKSVCETLKAKAQGLLASESLQSINQEIETRRANIIACQQDGEKKITRHRSTLTQLLNRLIEEQKKLSAETLAPYLSAVQSELQQALELHLPMIYSTVELNADQVSQILQQPSEETGLVIGGEQSSIEDQLLSVLSSGVGEDVIKGLMSQLPKVLGPILSTGGQNALNGLLSVVSRGLGPMVMLGSLYLQFRNAQKREEEMERRAIAQQRQKVEACQEASQLLETKMIEQWREVLNGVTKLALSPLNSDQQKLQAEDAALSQLIEKVADVDRQLQFV